MTQRTGFALMDSVISEMDSTVSDELVTVDKDVIENVKQGDEDPLFITMQVLAEGVSKNKRNYTAETVKRVADAVNVKRPYGYQGHLSEEERKTKAPDPLVMWLGASTKVEDGRTVMYARGYVYPYATKFKTQLRKAKAVGKNVAMSIQGTANAVFNKTLQAYDLSDFNLNTIDFARDGAEGVPNNGTLILASEMHDDKIKEGDNAMNTADVLKKTSLSELREHNPQLVSEMEGASEQLVSEMDGISDIVGAKDSKKTVTELVSEMNAENAELRKKITVSEMKIELTNKVKASGARPIIEQMVVSEMEAAESKVTISEMIDSVLGSEEGKAVMSQFTSRAPKIAVGGKKPEAKASRSFTNKKFN